MKRLVKYFLNGLLIFVPAAVTVLVIVLIFTKLDNLMGIPYPGLGLLITIAAITILGFLVSNFIGKKLVGLVEKIFMKIPLVKMLYSSVKDMIEAFAGEKKKFNKPAVVELVAGGPKALGFITRETLDALGLENQTAVYLPQSYNFAGSVLIFPSDQVKPLDIDSSKAMTFIVSGGVSGIN